MACTAFTAPLPVAVHAASLLPVALAAAAEMPEPLFAASTWPAALMITAQVEPFWI